ncbi:hypothetical protein AWM75_06205 [Aerococcus urinaehominis]|uniref:Uncharacterized protein n=1 Tax=Aerococcus urinaehominis TaxID=128944 RepID=A0A0X8FLT8_9LACT|nr:nucleoid-associated protein [Aerococcus urinaehominis]AMB99597.1 hypothetical protein AWM75_06205 [Aerococcus urinaehominis]SDL86887.1 hypothetical protein SAMN04487985_10239 [Aerococcus urinaehominis]
MDIKQAILHIYDPDSQASVLSQHSLALDKPVTKEYIEAMVDKVIATSKQKSGQLGPSARQAQLDQVQADNFISQSQELSQDLMDIFKANPDIPPADLLWLRLAIDGYEFVGCIKLNHSSSMTHHIDYQDEALATSLLNHQAILPSKTQAIDEGFLYCQSTGEYFLVEKKHLLVSQGERGYYLSQTFMAIQEPPASMQEDLQVLKRAITKTADQYADPAYQDLAQAKQVLMSHLEDTEEVVQADFARALYPDNPGKQATYLDQATTLGLGEATAIKEEYLTARMHKQKLRLSNGIELSIPLDIYQDPQFVEFKNNPDGTVQVVLKNIESIKNLF